MLADAGILTRPTALGSASSGPKAKLAKRHAGVLRSRLASSARAADALLEMPLRFGWSGWVWWGLRPWAAG